MTATTAAPAGGPPGEARSPGWLRGDIADVQDARPNGESTDWLLELPEELVLRVVNRIDDSAWPNLAWRPARQRLKLCSLHV